MAGRFFGAGTAPAADTAEQEERDAGAVPSQPTAEGEKRLALVIGNAGYVAEPLANAATDANLISRVLPALGFETTRIEDADAEALRSGVIGFANAVALAGPGSVAFVYYAGHGIQVGDANYLLPVDVTAAGLATAEPKLMALSQLIALLSAARPKAAALIIDACRNGPPGFQPLSANPSGGQAATDRPPDGMLIAYSTAAGATADDGERQNGPYAAALAQELPRLLEPGVRIHDVFVTTGERVREQTGGAQSPALYLQGTLPVLAVTEEDLNRFRTWDFQQKAGLGARLLQILGAAAIGLAALAIGVSWFSAEPEVRARRLHDWGVQRSMLFDLDCAATAADRFGLTPADWCRTAARDLVAPVKAGGAWNDRVVAPAAAGDPAALLLLAEDQATLPNADLPGALRLALRAARVGWLPAWETVSRLQFAAPLAVGAAEPAELLAGLEKAGDAGVIPADIVAAWNAWNAGRLADAEARFIRADAKDASGGAARWHAEALLRGSPAAGRAPDYPAGARRLLAACGKGDAQAAMTLLDLDGQHLLELRTEEIDACAAVAASGQTPDAAYVKAVLDLRKDSPPDPAATRRLLERAADAGHVRAMLLLAGLHASGDHGLTRDPQAARTLAERAASSGNLRAQVLLATLLLDGETSAGDEERARTLLESAVRAGDVEAALILGNLHASGAFADSSWDKARALADYAKTAAAATNQQRFEGNRLLERAERGSLIARMTPSEARIGAGDAPMRLVIGVPVPCETCEALLLDIMPKLLASYVAPGLLALDLRIVQPEVSGPIETLSDCRSARYRAEGGSSEAIGMAPAWRALPQALKTEAIRAFGQLAWDAGCKRPAKGEQPRVLTGQSPVLVANGSVIDRQTIDTVRRGLIDAAPPRLRSRLTAAGLDGQLSREMVPAQP